MGLCVTFINAPRTQAPSHYRPLPPPHRPRTPFTYTIYVHIKVTIDVHIAEHCEEVTFLEFEL